jgi:hypothetical protein
MEQVGPVGRRLIEIEWMLRRRSLGMSRFWLNIEKRSLSWLTLASMGSNRGLFVAYYRVSTQRQGASGLGLETQQRAVRDHLDGGGWTPLREVVRIESGKRQRHR